jgi:type IV pilus assembly protein PilA
MNTYFLKQVILVHKIKQRNQDGFTLIELLVVVIILGILAAVSMPNYLNQIGKARETEATNFLGSLARSQQAYHYENNTFAPTMNALTLNINLNPDYYSFPDPSSADANVAIHTAIPVDAIKYNIKNYSAGIYQNAGNFAIALCQGNAVSQTVNAPNTVSGTCTNGGIRLK